MLIEFRVKNYRCFRDEQTLSLVPAKDDTAQDSLIETGCPSVPKLLRSAVLYGPNASGKSTLLDAMRFVRRFVRNSAKGQSGDKIRGALPFKLNAGSAAAPCHFELSFIADPVGPEAGPVRYEYGLVVDQERVHQEWLHAFPESRRQRWFDRVRQDDGQEDIKFSPHVKGMKNVWKKVVRPNASLLSTAVQLNDEQMRQAFQWVEKTLKIVNSDNLSHNASANDCLTEGRRQKVMHFLQKADFSIDGVRVEAGELTADFLPPEMPEEMKAEIIEDMKGQEVIREIQFSHRSDDGRPVYLDLEEESQGTQKFFCLSTPVIDTLENGLVTVLDELSNSLHPLLSRALIDAFHQNRGTPAQLIFTTHDPSLLSAGIFRRDQIWLTDRTRSGAATLTPLSDFKARKDEPLEKHYLQGRYGGVPFLPEGALL